MTSSTRMSTLVVLLLFCIQPIFSQIDHSQTPPSQPNRTCSTMELHEQKMLTNKAYKTRFKEKLANAQNVISNPQANVALCANPVIIPMAVHYQGISTPNAADMDCLIALAENQIQILNDDYHGTNSDISTWNTNSVHFPGVENGETCIQFCLANINHPTGYNLSDGDIAVTFNEFSGDFNSDWTNYLNIFVRDINFLGFSPLGGDGNGDGVTVDDDAFGSGAGCSGVGVTPSSPYNLGRTLTHELGHYLLLDHIWGGGCGNDDGIGDTPDSNDPWYGCPSIPSQTCGSNDMSMNYMDYTNDACMYMFSEGQSTVMENYVASNLANLTNNAPNVCGTVQPSIAFTSSASSFIEGTSSCNGGGTQTISVQIAISSPPSTTTIANISAFGTATSGQDFSLSTSSVSFPAGVASIQTINLTITEDAYIEGPEDIQLSYTLNSNGGDAIEGTANQTHTVTIDNDDFLPAASGEITLLNETFNSGATGWTVTNGGGNTTWGLSSAFGSSTNTLDGSPFMIIDTRFNNSNYDDVVTSPSLNSDGMTAITLKFDQYINVRNNNPESLDVDVWNGSSWQNVFNWNQSNGDVGGWNNPNQVSVDITAHANPNMQVRFAYTASRGRWWAVDNVQITATSNTEIQTDNNSGAGSADHHLGPFETVHFYDMNTGNIMMTIENTSAHDYGCTTVEVDQSATNNPGASSSSAPEAGFITSKNFLVSPEFNNPAGTYILSLYYTAAEINGWAAAAGLPIIDLEIVKSSSNISTATLIELITPTVSDFSGDYIYTGSFTKGFSGFALGNPASILPVEMLDFSATAKEKSILLNWATASESNNKGFEILRSTETANDFIPIGWLDGYGNSTEERNYRFEDSQVQEGLTYYYQLRQIDFDEKTSTSSIVSGKISDKEGNSSFNIYPNPARSSLQVNLFAKADGLLKIIDVTGRIIKQDNYKIGEQSFSIDLSNLERGIYWVLTQEESLEIQVQKFVKM